MKIIGLTGGSGTGKSTVARHLHTLGAGRVDADAIYRRLCQTSHTMLDELAQAFGGVILPDGTLNRQKLAGIVFADPEKLRRLNEITLPYILAASRQAMTQQGARHSIVLFDAPTLFESGADALCDQTIGVVAEDKKRVALIMLRDHLSEQAAWARIHAQPDIQFYQQRCDYILMNDGSRADLKKKAGKLYETIKESACFRVSSPDGRSFP